MSELLVTEQEPSFNIEDMEWEYSDNSDSDGWFDFQTLLNKRIKDDSVSIISKDEETSSPHTKDPFFFVSREVSTKKRVVFNNTLREEKSEEKNASIDQKDNKEKEIVVDSINVETLPLNACKYWNTESDIGSKELIEKNMETRKWYKDIIDSVKMAINNMFCEDYRFNPYFEKEYYLFYDENHDENTYVAPFYLRFQNKAPMSSWINVLCTEHTYVSITPVVYFYEIIGNKDKEYDFDSFTLIPCVDRAVFLPKSLTSNKNNLLVDGKKYLNANFVTCTNVYTIPMHYHQKKKNMSMGIEKKKIWLQYNKEVGEKYGITKDLWFDVISHIIVEDQNLNASLKSINIKENVDIFNISDEYILSKIIPYIPSYEICIRFIIADTVPDWTRWNPQNIIDLSRQFNIDVETDKDVNIKGTKRNVVNQKLVASDFFNISRKNKTNLLTKNVAIFSNK